jgi:hypothetical protein
VSTQQESTARPTGPGRSFLGLLWALAPVLVVLLLLVWWQKGGESPVLSVDPGPDIAYAQRVSPVPLPAPGPLPGDWRATSSHVDAPAGEARRSPVTLTVGYLTGADKFAEVVTGDRPVRTILLEVAPAATAEGTVTVGAAKWDAYRNKRGERVLATTLGEAGVIVTGDAADTDLVALAGAVRLPAATPTPAG